MARAGQHGFVWSGSASEGWEGTKVLWEVGTGLQADASSAGVEPFVVSWGWPGSHARPVEGRTGRTPSWRLSRSRKGLSILRLALYLSILCLAPSLFFSKPRSKISQLALEGTANEWGAVVCWQQRFGVFLFLLLLLAQVQLVD